MNKGDMMQVLARAEKTLADPAGGIGLLLDPSLWQTLDVDYEPPHVERLFTQFEDDYRLFLHVIYPCEKALFHPHPWPSAVKVLKGGVYEMGTGFSSDDEPPCEIVTVELREGSSYEMIDRDAWHYVRPIHVPSMSIMVTGPKWDAKRWSPNPDHKLEPLTRETKIKQLAMFRKFYLGE